MSDEVRTLERDDVADITRQMDKALDAMDYSQRAFERESEKNAALHLSDKIMYVPIVGKLDEARRALGNARDRLVGE